MSAPAGDLSNALRQLAIKSGVNLLFLSETVTGKKTTGAREARSIGDALTQILAGTGLRYKVENDGSISVAPADPVAVRQDGETANGSNMASRAFPEVLVEADRLRDPAVAAEMDDGRVSSVLSAEMMARHTDANVAEALARLPGVSVSLTTLDHYLGGVDTAARGEGEFVAIRGLDSEYNVSLVNGVNVAQSMPYSRQMNLALMPPLGLDKIVVRKSSTADMDGDAIGGTIDFQSPTAFDSDGLFTRISTRGQINGRALDYGLDSEGGAMQVESAGKFGPGDRFGIYATAYYDHHNFVTSELDWQADDFGYRLSDAKGSSAAGMSSNGNLVLGGVNAQFSKGDTERYGGTLSLDWRGDDNTAYFRSTYGYSYTQQDIFQIGLQSRSLVSSTALGNGDLLNQTTDAQLHYWFETNPELAELTTNKIGGTSDFGGWRGSWTLFYSWGQNSRPDHVETSWGLEGPDQYSYVGALGSPLGLNYVNGYPIPVLTAAQLAKIGDLSSYMVHNQGELNIMQSDQHRTGGQIDLSFDVGQWGVDALKVGVKDVASYRFIFDRDWNIAIASKGETLADSPLVARILPSVIPGVYDYPIAVLNGDKVRSLILSGLYSLNADDYNGNTMSGWEQVSSAYAMIEIRQGPVEIVPGVRFERTAIDSTYWNAASQDSALHGWASSHTGYHELLPSLAVNYRPSPGSVYRAGVWSSYSRPSFFQLGGGTQTTVGTDGAVTVAEGNPHLRAIQATNFDLAGEWSCGRGGQVSIAAYHKALQHYLYNSGASYPAGGGVDDGTLSITRPNNGGSARVTGVELSASQKFVWLAAPLDGFGISGNATVQRSLAHLNDPLLASSDVMQGTPDRLANLALFYERKGLFANLAYRYTGYYVEQYGEWGTSFFNTKMNGSDLDKWVHPTGSLDFNVKYRFENGLEIGAAVKNLMGGTAYYSTIGKKDGSVPQIIDAGRLFIATTSLTF